MQYAKRRSLALAGFGLLTALALSGCGSGDRSGTPAAKSTPTACGTYDGEGCAPKSRRVDLAVPSFSSSTEITNPLFPISRLRSTVLLGHVDDKPFRTETTLLPGTRTVEWNGKRIQALTFQYMAYLDGRITEVAIDFYAQADDGSVWYLGEDVYDYENGTVAITEGTWQAGRDGPGAMIMPAEPKVGDVYRPENVEGIVFEEVTVKSVDRTVQGPRGPVRGAILTDELHADGSREGKLFAPGYGEFRTAGGGDLEALALAVPTDALPGSLPPELRFLSTSSVGVLELSRKGDWEPAAAVMKRMSSAWGTLNERQQPPMIAERLSENLTALTRAVQGRKPGRVAQKAIDVAQSVLDLELRHRPAAEIDVERFHLWTQQLRIDSAAEDLAGVTGTVATLEWIRDRVAHTLSPAGRQEIDSRLRALRVASDQKNLTTAADHAARLGARLRTLSG
ncbi:hypothetical protein BH18ACT12_BH18ACT12_24070 [soil metagenome]